MYSAWRTHTCPPILIPLHPSSSVRRDLRCTAGASLRPYAIPRRRDGARGFPGYTQKHGQFYPRDVLYVFGLVFITVPAVPCTMLPPGGESSWMKTPQREVRAMTGTKPWPGQGEKEGGGIEDRYFIFFLLGHLISLDRRSVSLTVILIR